MATPRLKRLRDDLERLAQRGADVDDLSRAASRVVRRAVECDGVCLVTIDPPTLLPTGEFVENGLPEETRARMAEIEVGGRDYNAFGALARSERGVAALSAATGGVLDRSLRHRELKAPNGFGDELRAVLADETGTWGGLTLLRGDDRPHFSEAETAAVATLARPLAEGLRRAVLVTDRLVARGDEDDPPGLLLLAGDGSLLSSDAAAGTWLAELSDSPGLPLPAPVGAVARRARALARDPDADQSQVRVRVRTRRGGWLVVRATTLGDEPGAMTAVSLEPARPRDLAPLIAAAHELTARERAIARLVAEGLSTRAIAQRLYLSPWTVQDHLKAIFEKVGVTTRGELVARLFLGHRAPPL
jgi:DNA-binding CsgD family transcriptional regulator